ncbi:MAG TPA: GYF domain-containing protein, partial [Flavobacterium sp.]|nr:GYF domain-containing protein [Flavobacterium sp.]
MKTCAYCGKENQETAVYCRECGAEDFKCVRNEAQRNYPLHTEQATPAATFRKSQPNVLKNTARGRVVFLTVLTMTFGIALYLGGGHGAGIAIFLFGGLSGAVCLHYQKTLSKLTQAIKRFKGEGDSGVPSESTITADPFSAGLITQPSALKVPSMGLQKDNQNNFEAIREIEWYYAIEHEKHGPVSQRELIEKISTGQLVAETKLWKTGMSKWILLKNSEFAFAIAKNGPPPLTEVEDGSVIDAPDKIENKGIALPPKSNTSTSLSESMMALLSISTVVAILCSIFVSLNYHPSAWKSAIFGLFGPYAVWADGLFHEFAYFTYGQDFTSGLAIYLGLPFLIVSWIASAIILRRILCFI